MQHQILAHGKTFQCKADLFTNPIRSKTCHYTYTKTTTHFRSGGGTSLSDRDRIAALERKIELLETTIATEEIHGLVRLSSSSTVTDSTGLALPSSENNASLEGSIAQRIERCKEISQINKSAIEKMKLNNSESSSTLASPGWYRIAVYRNGAQVIAEGASANSCDIVIKRVYNTADNEVHFLRLLSVYHKSSIVAVSQLWNTKIIKKIRHTVHSSGTKAYIEIYYDHGNENSISYSVNNAADAGGRWNTIIADKTQETVEGVSVYSTLNL